MLGDTIGGRYQIQEYLGGGGFGQTYLAQDIHLPGCPKCVIKQLKPKVADPITLQSARRLFDTEAQALYALGSHDRIPRLLAHFEENQQFYLAQELIEGQLLSQELGSGRCWSEAKVIDVLDDLLSTLAFVHEQGVIHRDIKPSNLIRRQVDQKIVMIDFGSVKQVGHLSAIAQEQGQVSITIAVGSLGYMPNEQLAGQPCLSSDIYAVGMLAIQALTGIDPKTLKKDVRTSEILWRDQAVVSDWLADIIDRMVRYDFRQRYSSAAEALFALRQAQDDDEFEADETIAIAPAVSPPLAAVCSTDESEQDTELEHIGLDEAASEDEQTLELYQGSVVFNQSEGHLLVWMERGDELFQSQRFGAALACYERITQARPEDYLAWFKQAIALENMQQYASAAESYQQVIRLRPNDYLAWYRQGKALEVLERWQEALAAYREVTRLQPNNYWVWHDRGQVLEQLQNQEAAIAAYTKAVQIKPDFQLAIDSRKRLLNRLERVEQLYQLQHYEDAIASCDQLIEQEPDNSLAWLMRGMAMENLGQLKAAVSSYARVTRLQPSDHLAWYKQASVLEKIDRYADALAAYNQVVELQPENCWAWHDRGRMLEQIGQLEEAVVSYDRAVQLKSGFQEALQSCERVMNRLKHRQVLR
ncbi:MAG: tetratricopeptide repeat protein [Thainema sp.]